MRSLVSRSHAPAWERSTRRSAEGDTRRQRRDAERPIVRSHAPRGNEEIITNSEFGNL